MSDGARADPRRVDLVAAAATVATSLAALAVGIIGIGRSFGYDEAVTYTSFVNGGSIRRALTEQVVFNNHQMFSAIQALAWRLGLVGESAQRLLPVACGAATVGLLTWWLTRRCGALAGVSAGALLLLDPVYLSEFRQLRGYALSTLAALVAVVVTHRSWSDRRRRWHVIAGVAMVVAVTTHAYAVLPIVCAAIATAAVGRIRRDHLLTWVAAAVTAALIQLPLLDDARDNSTARGSRYLPGFLRFAFEQYFGGRRAVVAIVAALCVVGLATVAGRSRGHAIAVGGSLAFVAAVAVVLWQVVRPYDLYVRFFVSLTPYLAAAVGIGAARLPHRIGVVPVAVALALLVPGARTTLEFEPPIRDAAAVVDAARDRGIEVCAAFPLPLSVYTAPVRAVDTGAPDGPTGFGDCELFVAVIGIGSAGREVAAARFEEVVRVPGGLTFYTDAEGLELIRAELGTEISGGARPPVPVGRSGST